MSGIPYGWFRAPKYGTVTHVGADVFLEGQIRSLSK